jgi:hypothetical protein
MSMNPPQGAFWAWITLPPEDEASWHLGYCEGWKLYFPMDDYCMPWTSEQWNETKIRLIPQQPQDKPQ